MFGDAFEHWRIQEALGTGKGTGRFVFVFVFFFWGGGWVPLDLPVFMAQTISETIQLMIRFENH